MKLSDDGLFALALHEGIVPGPYRDVKRVWTYGIGHTAAAGGPVPAKMARGMPGNINAALADVFALFAVDVAKYEAAVARAVKVPVSQSQFDALVSFHFNTGAIGKASLVDKLNAGNVSGAAAGFMAWRKPASIIARRKAERDLFESGKYPTGKIPVYGVTDAGAVIWKPVKWVGKAEALELIASGRRGVMHGDGTLRKPQIAQPGAVSDIAPPPMSETRPVADVTRPAPHVTETPKIEHDAPIMSAKSPWAALLAFIASLFRKNSA